MVGNRCQNKPCPRRASIYHRFCDECRCTLCNGKRVVYFQRMVPIILPLARGGYETFPPDAERKLIPCGICKGRGAKVYLEVART